MFIAGLVANDARPDREVVTTATLDTPVVVLGPEVVALQGLTRIAITADGEIEAHEARDVDADAWLKRHSATYVTGFAGWDALETRTESRVVLPSEEPSPSPSPDATSDPSPSPTPSETAATPTPAAEPEVDNGATDHWRSTWRGVDRVSIASNAIAPGDTIVVFTADGSNLTNVQFTAVRQVNDGWINPLIWIGGALGALGALAVLSGLIDTRPAQAKVEAWMRGRAKVGAEPSPRPGSRRERRLAGSTLPAADLAEDSLSGPAGSAHLTTHAWDVEPETPGDTSPSTDKGGAL
jgi:hypothetical protein